YVLVPPARGDLAYGNPAWLPADQRTPPGGGYGVDHLRVGGVAPVGEPVHDVQALAQLRLELEDRLHALPHAAVREGADHHAVSQGQAGVVDDEHLLAVGGSAVGICVGRGERAGVRAGHGED